MPDLGYQKIQALIIDDFDSFRDMLFAMLQELGILRVDVAASANEALRLCGKNTYDIILCDQNLGPGKSGQHILEVLRNTPNHNSDSLFVLISAESNKDIIMASFDYEPDDYLTKPITTQSLAQRLDRLLSQRLILTPIYKALKQSNTDVAIELCREEINSNHRYKNYCQKLLGRLLLKMEQLDDAEQLYREILDVRQLDWAMLGMANVKKLKGDSLSAQQWLEEIIQFNPLCLKAYDVLADILRERDDTVALQQLLVQAVELSPLSILRQRALGEVALINNDTLIAANAFRKAVKLGENSYYDSLTYLVNFVHAVIQLSVFDKNIAKAMLREAIKYVSDMPSRFGKTTDNRVSSYLLEVQLQVASGDIRKSKEAMASVNSISEREKKSLSLMTKIEWVNALRAMGNVVEANRLTVELSSYYAASEEALQKIDCLLDEPRSIKNKQYIAKINQEGITHFNAQDFSRSVLSFKRALQKLPKHIGLRLNLLQTLIAILKTDRKNSVIATEAQQLASGVASVIPDTHGQYQRFRHLEMALRDVVNGTGEKLERSHYN